MWKGTNISRPLPNQAAVSFLGRLILEILHFHCLFVLCFLEQRVFVLCFELLQQRSWDLGEAQAAGSPAHPVPFPWALLVAWSPMSLTGTRVGARAVG